MKLYLMPAIIVLIFIISLFVWYYFFGEIGELKKAKKEFEIFGLNEGFVPQGIAYIKKHNKFLISGYMSKKNEPSRLYVVDEKTHALDKFVTLRFSSGKSYFGHAGGIANNANNCWVSSEGKVYRFLVSDLIDAKQGQAIEIKDFFETENKADFCFLQDDFLWVGEFYKLGASKTDLTHHITCDGKKLSHALAFAYKLSNSENCVCGINSFQPQMALTLPDLAQGVVCANGKIFVSCSFGISKSTLLEYENVFLKKPQNYYCFGRKKVPIWTLSEKYLRKTHVYPEMLEQVAFVNGRLFMVFESGAKKYRLFTRTSINHVFSRK